MSLFSLMNSWWKLLDQVPVPRMEFHRHPQPEEQSEVKAELKVDIKVEEKKERHVKEHYHLHFSGLMLSFNLQLNSWNCTWSIIICQLNNLGEEPPPWSCQKRIYDTYDQITKSCDACSKSKIAPSRAKVSGIRSEVFGELTFIDHGEVPINPQSKLQFLLLYDGAKTSLATACVVQNRSHPVTIPY